MNHKIIILTDSTADLSDKLLAAHQIKSLPLYVLFGEETFQDGITINTPLLYKKVDELNYLPTTAAVSPGDFITFFKPYLKEGYDIIYIGIGSTLSSTYQSALLAKDVLESDHIHLIDSKNLSSGIALLVLKAKDLRDQGHSASQIVKEITQLVDLVRSQFAIKSLDYLHKGGRASGTAKLMGGILGIKPIIKVVDGTLLVYKKPAGKMSRALDMMLNDLFLELKKDNLDLDYIMITHSLAPKDVSYLKENILSTFTPRNLIESQAGCVISSHCGKGTIGILYLVKENL